MTGRSTEAHPSPDLSEVFHALSSPDRLAIVDQLARARATGDGELSITAVAQASGLDRFTASRHLRVLAGAGLVLVRRERTTVLHELIPEHLVRVEDWAYSIALAAEEPATKSTQSAPL